MSNNETTQRFQIKNRFSGHVQFECDISAETANLGFGLRLGFAVKKAIESGANLGGANLREANLGRANLRGVDLSRANLSRANLGRANLREANLREANLRGADLGRANLVGVNLREANLREANLSMANLSGADLGGADLGGADLGVVPVLLDIDAKILAAVEAEGSALDMGSWHTCETTHCRAGWAVHLCGEAGYKLEAAIGSAAAGALIYAASRPDKPVPNFYASNEEALADMRESAEV